MKKTAAIVAAIVLAFCLTVPAFAAGFTPSVSQKGAPKIITIRTEDGKKIGGIIKNSKGKTVIDIPTGDIVVTPVSESAAATEEIKEILDTAKEVISEEENLVEIIPEFEEKLAEVFPEAKAEELVVKDLFDVALYGTYAEYLAEEGNTLSIVFDAGIKEDAPFVAVFSTDGKNWTVIDSSLVKTLENGQVEIVISEPGVVAFLTDTSSVNPVNPDNPDGPVSPDTGDRVLPLAFAGAVCALAGCAFVDRSRKSK